MIFVQGLICHNFHIHIWIGFWLRVLILSDHAHGALVVDHPTSKFDCDQHKFEEGQGATVVKQQGWSTVILINKSDYCSRQLRVLQDPQCRPLQREDPRCRLRRGVPPWPGVVWRIPGRRPHLFDRCWFCASLLKAPLYHCVCTQILVSFANFVISSCCIRALVALACIK